MPGSTFVRVAAMIDEAASLLEWMRRNEDEHRTVERFSGRLARCLRRGGRILCCGNGGSMCDAMHFAEELSGRFRSNRRALAAQALSDPAHMTCVGNDFGFDRVFARGVEAWGKRGDALVVFTTSGNSANILAAAVAARQQRLDVIGFLGGDGGKTKTLCDEFVVVPVKPAERVQEVHIKLVHLVIEEIERQLVPENYPAPATPVRRRPRITDRRRKTGV